MIAILFAGLLTAAPAPTPAPILEPQNPVRRGVAGVCIRWDQTRNERVAEAIIVRSTGNVPLDRRIAHAIPDMDWPVGVDDYRGQWVGIWMAVGGAESPPATDPVPDCSAQTDHSWAPAPSAPST